MSKRKQNVQGACFYEEDCIHCILGRDTGGKIISGCNSISYSAMWIFLVFVVVVVTFPG